MEVARLGRGLTKLAVDQLEQTTIFLLPTCQALVSVTLLTQGFTSKPIVSRGHAKVISLLACSL